MTWRRWLLVLLAVAALVCAVPVVWFVFVLSPQVRGDLVTVLAQRYGGRVEIGELDWTFLPSPVLRGGRVTIHRDDPASGGGSSAPLIALDTFTFDTGWRDLLASPRRIRRVAVDGLRVTIPSRRASVERATGPTAGPVPDAGTEGSGEADASAEAEAGPIVIDAVTARNVRVEFGSSRPDKPPRVFLIPALEVQSITTTGPIRFDAIVDNPRPPGRVETSGRFGPWDRAEPSATALEGEYRFMGADLGVFGGIAGTLDAAGRFAGEFDDIEVTGRAEIPDFALDTGQPVAMAVDFASRISDRGGDIALAPVESRFGDTALGVTGVIVRGPGAGRAIELDVTGRTVRIEDILDLVTRADEAPITGPMTLDAAIAIPPGPGRLIERLDVAGTFRLPRAVFTGTNVQATLERISRITSRGGAMSSTPDALEGGAESGTSVVSDLSGRFHLRDGAIAFEPVRFAVPGMQVQLTGTYDLTAASLDLSGRLLVERPPSEFVGELLGGRGARWLAMADQVLGRSGRGQNAAGLSLPLTITGPRDRPRFRIDLAAWRRDVQRNLPAAVEDRLGDMLRQLLPGAR